MAPTHSTRPPYLFQFVSHGLSLRTERIELGQVQRDLHVVDLAGKELLEKLVQGRGRAQVAGDVLDHDGEVLLGRGVGVALGAVGVGLHQVLQAAHGEVVVLGVQQLWRVGRWEGGSGGRWDEGQDVLNWSGLRVGA